MDRIDLKVPAKINLYLRVLDKRPDGYHNIDSLMQTVSLYDELTLEKANKIELICDDLADVRQEKNLAFKAAVMLSQIADFPGVRITLKKHIPSGAGLGGGSADAAFVIRGLVKLYELRPNLPELLLKTAQLGADVPFFLSLGQAQVGGIGELVHDVILPMKYHVLLVKPSFSVNTAQAYGELDKCRERKFCLTKSDFNTFLSKNITDQNFVRSVKEFINDLEEVVTSWHPELSQVKNYLLNQGAFYAGMSGSGSTMYGLFLSVNAAEETANVLLKQNYQIFVCTPILLPPVN